MVVTSGIIPIPAEWMELRRNRVAVSIDGLPEHHDPRRKPATYDPHPGKHPRPRSKHSLDDHRADDEASRISRRISGILAGAAGSEADLGEPLQSAARANTRRKCSPWKSGNGWRGNCPRLRESLSQAADEPGHRASSAWSRPKIRRNVCSPKCRRTFRPI